MATQEPKYPWPLYETPVYWSLKDDGAPAKCSECGEYDNMKNFILLQTPNGRRSCGHKDCITYEDWWNEFKPRHLGVFPE